MATKGERLCSAARNNNIELIKTLLNEGFSIEARDKEGRTPLLWAIRFHSQDALRVLLEKGADVKARCNDGGGALHELFRGPYCSKSETILSNLTLLIDKGVDVNGRDNESLTPLHFSGVSGYGAECAALLIDNGADVNAKTLKGLTPLHEAIESESRAYFAALIEKGADVTACDNEGRTPLHYILIGSHREAEAMIALLLKKGADINARDKSGSTALHYAVRYSLQREVALLLSWGADRNVCDVKGHTPLDVANALADVRGGANCRALLQSTIMLNRSEMSSTATRQGSGTQGQSASFRPISTTVISQGSGSQGQSASSGSISATATSRSSESQGHSASSGSISATATSRSNESQGHSASSGSISATATSRSSESQGHSASSGSISATATSQGSRDQARRAVGSILDQIIEKQFQQIEALETSQRAQSQEIGALKQIVSEQSRKIASLQRFQRELMATELNADPNPLKRRRREPLPPLSPINENERRPNPMASSVRQPRLLGINSNMLFNRRNTLPPEGEVASSTGERTEVSPNNISITGEGLNSRANVEPEKEVMLQGTGDASFMGVNRLFRAERLQSIKKEPSVANIENQPQQRPKSPGI